MFTLRQIKYFVAVAEQGTVSGAARTLSISQSSVTEAIRELEADLGVELFARAASGMTLTHHGLRFLPRAAHLLASASRARQAFDAPDDATSGTLNIGVTSLVAAYAFAEMLARYRRAFPDVAVTAMEDDAAYLEHLLVAGKLDLAMMVVSDLREPDALQAEITHVSRYRLWLHAGHPLASKTTIELADLAGTAMIQLLRDEVRNVAQELFPQPSTAPRIAFHTRSVEAIRSLVATGEGVAILPDIVYRGWSLDGDQIVTREIAPALPVTETGLVWRKGSALSWEAREFIALARDHRR
ncbi:MAG: LysR family transcriptional regulator [Pseudomonadota bacterium]